MSSYLGGLMTIVGDVGGHIVLGPDATGYLLILPSRMAYLALSQTHTFSKTIKCGQDHA